MTATTTSPTSPRARKGPTTLGRIGRWAMNNGALVGLILLCIGLFIATPAVPDRPEPHQHRDPGVRRRDPRLRHDLRDRHRRDRPVVGSVAALGAVVSAYSFASLNLPGILTLVIGLLVGAAAGAISGLSIAYGKLPAFIATLAMMSVARGLTLVISNGTPITTSESVSFMGGTIGSFPVPILAMVVAGLVCWFILTRTVLGRSMYAIGGNEEAARLSGLPVKRILVIVYALSGLFAASPAWSWPGDSPPPVPRPAWATSWTPSPPVVIGGASLSGGSGRATGHPRRRDPAGRDPQRPEHPSTSRPSGSRW